MFKVGDMVVLKQTDDDFLRRCDNATHGGLTNWILHFRKDKSPHEIRDINLRHPQGTPNGTIIVNISNGYWWKVPTWALKLYNSEPSKPYTSNTPGDYPQRRQAHAG